jgi:hypothetical protein
LGMPGNLWLENPALFRLPLCRDGFISRKGIRRTRLRFLRACLGERAFVP